MPSIARTIAATTTDALNGLKFKTQDRPALVSLYAAAQAAGGSVSFSVGQREFVVDANLNVEVAVDSVDTDRDQILFSEPVPAGEYFMPVTIGGTGASFILVIEPL